MLGYFEEPRYTETNGAMLRPNGTLHVVIISDSPEQSAVSVPSFTSTLSARTAGKTSDIVIHALAFTPEECPGQVEDLRMAQVVDDTGGVRADFCVAADRGRFFAAVIEAVSPASRP